METLFAELKRSLLDMIRDRPPLREAVALAPLVESVRSSLTVPPGGGARFVVHLPRDAEDHG